MNHARSNRWVLQTEFPQDNPIVSACISCGDESSKFPCNYLPTYLRSVGTRTLYSELSTQSSFPARARIWPWMLAKLPGFPEMRPPDDSGRREEKLLAPSSCMHPHGAPKYSTRGKRFEAFLTRGRCLAIGLEPEEHKERLWVYPLAWHLAACVGDTH